MKRMWLSESGLPEEAKSHAAPVLSLEDEARYVVGRTGCAHRNPLPQNRIKPG